MSELGLRLSSSSLQREHNEHLHYMLCKCGVTQKVALVRAFSITVTFCHLRGGARAQSRVSLYLCSKNIIGAQIETTRYLRFHRSTQLIYRKCRAVGYGASGA